MDPQLAIVLLIVCGAIVYIGRHSWRTWSGKKSGCGKGCDCSAEKADKPARLIAPDQLTLRMKGQSDSSSRR